MNKLMKRPYVNPVCTIVTMTMQSPCCLLTGSFSVEDMISEEEQTVGGDE